MDANNEPLTSQEFVQSFEKLKHPLSLSESEESWDQMYKGFQQLGKLCQPSVFEHTAEVISSFRSIHRNLIGAINSERTRLSGAALDVLSILSAGLGTEFDPLLPLFFPSLLSLCGRTNKVIVSRAKACILAIIEATQLPGIITYLAQFSKDKSPTVRLVVVEGTLSCLKCFNPPDLEKESLSLCIETLIRNSVRDANADIRKVGKDVFQSYKVLLPHRVENFAAPLTPTIRKYLQITAGSATSYGGPVSVVAQPRPISRVTTQGCRAQSALKSGPTQLSKEISHISKPAASVPSLESSRVIQISAKRSVDNPLASLAQKPSTTTSRPFAQDKNATGPQRVIKPEKNSTKGPSGLPADKIIKASTTRLLGPSRSRAVSSSSLIRSDSQPAARSNKQMPATRKLLESDKPSGDAGVTTTTTRDLSRPTLSQLARVRPPVTKSVTKVVRGLEIRKTKLSTKPKSSGSTAAQGQSLDNKGCTANVLAGPPEVVRPTTPAFIPLPPSPSPSTPSPKPNLSDGTTLKESKPELVAAPADGQALQQAVFGENLALTPKADGDIPEPNLAFKTPISALLSSIQHGFDLTPCSPLSPPQDYIVSSGSPLDSGPFRLGVSKQSVPASAQP